MLWYVEMTLINWTSAFGKILKLTESFGTALIFLLSIFLGTQIVFFISLFQTVLIKLVLPQAAQLGSHFL